MEVAMAIAAIMGPVYLLLGLSLLFYGNQWQKLMAAWRKDHFALFPLMFLHAVFGVLVVNMYNVWDGTIWILVTLTGWAMVLKSVAYFLLPGNAIKSMMQLSDNLGLMYFGGLLAVVIGGALSYNAYFLV